jgi:glycosyltransferase involved in cell wall biosynthesis
MDISLCSEPGWTRLLGIIPKTGQPYVQDRVLRKLLLSSSQQPNQYASTNFNSESSSEPVRILAFMEALWPTTGPAKNLLEFAGRAAIAPGPLPRADITIATYHRGNGPVENDFVIACQRAGLEIHVLRERFLFDLAVVSAIRRLIEVIQPDIIQTHAVKSHFLVRLAGIHRDRPWIAFHHGYTWTSLRTRFYNELDRWSLRAPDKVVTVCRPFALTLENIGVPRDRIVVRHNAVKTFSPASLETTAQLRQSLGIHADAKVVLCVGRLSREKAQSDFIRAAACIRADNPKRNIRFIIAGEGPDHQMLRDLAKACRVDDWVLFVGQIAEVAPYYTTADVAVLPSHSEGSPNVLLEAMAGGLPVVATAVGGVPEIVEDEKQALLVDKQNPSALARAIERLLDDPALCVRLSYTPESYRDSILSLYQSCLTARPAAMNSR